MAKAVTAPPSDDVDTTSAPKVKSGKPWLAIVIAIVLSVLVSVGGSFVLMRHLIDGIGPTAEAGAEEHAGEKTGPKAPPNYVPLDPAFVVNLDAPGEVRFLQVQVQLMAREPKAVDVVKLHEPQLRNALLLLFSQQKPEDVASRAGVEKLQAAALAEVQRVLSGETGKPTVEALYFTSFVAQ